MHKRFNELHRVTTFNGLDEDYMEMLKPMFEPFSCRAGEMVLQQGSQADYLYIILSGRVQVSFKPYDGAPITVSHLETGGLFGWSAVVGSDKYTSSTIAIEDLEAVRLSGSELRRLCMSHPEAGKAILEHLASAVSLRWKDAHEQVKSILANGMKSDK
jgi:CRP/FNR family transcriptional regulator, cyclic AMP receptor protein